MTDMQYWENAYSRSDIKLVARKKNLEQIVVEGFVFSFSANEHERRCFHSCGQAARCSMLLPKLTLRSVTTGNIASMLFPNNQH